jgi:murein DD-endopeptidase MepM/ murein hydrolase activator NlpD
MIYLISILLTVFTLFSNGIGSDYNDENTFSIITPLVNESEIVAGFGLRYHPVLKEERMHHGIDYKVSIGDPVIAAGKGTVITLENNGSYGNMIKIQHESGFVTRYAHLSEFHKDLYVGLKVEAGQIIAFAGNSGFVTGPTLHFELFIDGEAVDPLLYMD